MPRLIHCRADQLGPVTIPAWLRLPFLSTTASGAGRRVTRVAPVGFGDEVACFAVKTDAELLLIDPLLPADPAPVHELVDAQGGEDGIAVLITIPYHVRDAERLRRKHGKRCTIWGHEACASRLTQRAGFYPITHATELPARVRARAIGSPRRQEQPLWIPSHKALAFGDAVIETGDRLRSGKMTSAPSSARAGTASASSRR